MIFIAALIFMPTFTEQKQQLTLADDAQAQISADYEQNYFPRAYRRLAADFAHAPFIFGSYYMMTALPC